MAIRFSLLLLAVVAYPMTSVACQTKQNPLDNWQDEAISPEDIVAQVNAESITYREVQNQLQLSIGEKPEGIRPEQYARLQANALKQVAEQKIVVHYLGQKGRSVTDAQIKVEVERLTRRAESLGKKFDDFLNENNLTIETLQRNIEWQTGWRSYVDEQLTETNLEKIFESNRRIYDGSRIKVAHLLIKPASESTAELETAERTATSVYKQIQGGELEWATAVKKFSNAATKTNQGEIGWIKINGSMNESFTKAAFVLEVGEVSQPVRTPFGFHLIRCLEVEPGEKGWQDCAEQLRVDGAKQLFEWITTRHASKVSVEFTGKCPYFEPNSGDLKVSKQ